MVPPLALQFLWAQMGCGPSLLQGLLAEVGGAGQSRVTVTQSCSQQERLPLAREHKLLAFVLHQAGKHVPHG